MYLSDFLQNAKLSRLGKPLRHYELKKENEDGTWEKHTINKYRGAENWLPTRETKDLLLNLLAGNRMRK